MQPDLRSEKGISLVLALFGMVVMGALVTGAFFIGRVEQLAGNNTVWAGQAGEAADAGLIYAANNIDADKYLNLAVWSPSAPTEMTTGTRTVAGMPGFVFTDTVRRLNTSLFLVRSTGQRVAPSGTVLAQQTLGMLVRMAKPTIGVNAAVTVQDPIKFNGNAFLVDGFNALPPQWGAGECDPVDAGNSDDVVGIRSAAESGAAAKDMDNIEGFPTKVVENDPTITSATFQDFLDYTYTTLANQPDVKELPLDTPYNGVAPVVDYSESPPVCDKDAPFNFGEPYRNPPTAGALTPCNSYFPVVHGTGGTTKFAAGNRGQGILLVDGDLEIVGGFEWTGLVIVRGQIKVTGTGNKIYGAILAEGADIATAGSIGGNVEVHYSACAVSKAVSGAAAPIPVSRGWTQLY